MQYFYQHIGESSYERQLHFVPCATLQWRLNEAMASQNTSLTIVYSTVYSGADQRKNQSSASLAFVRGIHRRPVNTPEVGWKDNVGVDANQLCDVCIRINCDILNLYHFDWRRYYLLIRQIKAYCVKISFRRSHNCWLICRNGVLFFITKFVCCLNQYN